MLEGDGGGVSKSEGVTGEIGGESSSGNVGDSGVGAKYI